MENKNLSTFVSDQFGSVRTLTIDGEPWFVAADVCRALGLEQTHKALHRLDSDEVGGGIKIPHPQSPEKAIEVSIVSESGLYSLVLASRKPEAKAFKRWITHEVIPAIRKTGAYAVPGTPMMTVEQAAVLLESMHAFVQNQSEFLACTSKVLDAMNAFTDVSGKLVQAVLDAKALPPAEEKPAPVDWHHRLTGSCMAGRKAFCLNHQIDLEHDSFTVDEFILLTKDDYGGAVIRNMATKRRENNAQ